jgi:hypothetical protein
MLNTASIAAIENAGWRGPFIRPLVDSHCFSNLPALVQHALTGEGEMAMPADVLGPLPHRHEAVVLFFIDGLGWRFIEPRLERYPFLQRVMKEGVVSKLTSMFPSTTSAHTTTIHTGLSPAQSGVYEWHQYSEHLDRIITPLMFAYPRDKNRDTLLNAGLKTSDVFPSRTIYQALARAGVKSHVYIARDLAKSAPTRALSEGASILSYKTFPEVLVNLADHLRRRTHPTYYFVYFSNIDTVCHDYGPGSPQTDAEIDAFFTLMERVLAPAARNTGALLLLTADHGQVEVDPKTTLYLNHTVPGFKRFIAVNGLGEWLAPAGSPRDFFLHIRPELLDEAQQAFASAMSGKGLVIKTSELIAAGFFGPQPGATFLKRVGNLVVLPFKGESAYFYERDFFENRFFGHHGGLTREEMEIPLLACVL